MPDQFRFCPAIEMVYYHRHFLIIVVSSLLVGLLLKFLSAEAVAADSAGQIRFFGRSSAGFASDRVVKFAGGIPQHRGGQTWP
jgi:hypothetical protein